MNKKRAYGHLTMIMTTAVLALTHLGCEDSESPVLSFPDPVRETGAVVSGVIATPQQQPVPEAIVTLEPVVDGVTASVAEAMGTSLFVLSGKDSAATPSLSAKRVTVADEHGHFSFDQIAPGTYSVSSILKDHQAGFATIEVLDPLTVDTVFVDIMITPTGSFSGFVYLESAATDGETIVFIPGSPAVSVTWPDFPLYILTDIPLGTYAIRAMHRPGYVSQEVQGTITTAGELVSLPGMTLKRDNNIPPVGIPILSDSTVCVGATIDFTAIGTDIDGSVVRYEWDFEDDGVIDWSHTNPDVSHQFNVAGDYVAKLRVIDDKDVATVSALRIAVHDAIYVSSTIGDDTYSGSPLRPVATISKGIQRSLEEACDLDVIVAQGNYNESIVLQTGVDVLGGYNATTWMPGGTSTVNAAQVVVSADSVSDVLVRDFAFIAGDAFEAPGWSVAMRASESGGTLAFENCAFTSGAGLAGNVGASGNPGTPGGEGDSVIVGPGFLAPGPGGVPGGGTGGAGGNVSAGSNGSPGDGAGGGSGGLGSAATSTTSSPCITGSPLPGGTGGIGGAGTPGLNSSGATPAGQATPTSWVPAPGNIGGIGGVGFGGGGGGGSGSFWIYNEVFQICTSQYGIPGAGGGGGGSGASGGFGGGGGGASFAVYLYDASPGFTDCTFTSGSGGIGGDGGPGGPGGPGGLGGLGFGGLGGSGGNGGAGGDGGGGQGGPGGVSFCVFLAGTSGPVITNPSYFVGSGGSGGTGGARGGTGALADPGPAGDSGIIGP